MTDPLDWTLATVVAATGGVADGDSSIHIHSVSTDSRSISPGSLFVAIKGEHHDGHDHAAAALAAGAVAAMVERGSADDIHPRVEVDDTIEGLIDLAVHRRGELDAEVVAITGSTGKTSTKDLLTAAFPGSWASPRSFNNEIGVPATVLTAPDDVETMILEVGSRGPGHIRRLAPAVAPDVAVITNLGVVHLETFGTRDALADGKFELVEALGQGGIAVLPYDEPRLARPHPGPTLTFGNDPAADVWVSHVEVDRLGRPRFRLHADGESVDVALALSGGHNAINAAAAAAAGLALGHDLEEVSGRLGDTEGSAWRMEVHPGPITIVNDAYNANPDSMLAALHTVSAMPGRHLAVLGEMAELGDVTEEEHARVGDAARDLGFDVITVGPDHGLAAAAGGRNVEDQAEAASIISAEAGDGSVVLVKASRAVGLERLAERLIEEAGA
jgi:UDP-N-acetylmuramoyl-tripeptide--D-alanyl-D-alanine ligase